MLDKLKIALVHAVYDPSVRDANALLDLYHMLTEWSGAMRAAGAEVSVVQRFHTPGRLERDGVSYEFVKDAHVPWLSTKAAPAELVGAIASQGANVVHVNSLIFPQLVAAIRHAVGPKAAIVAQHHGGEFPVCGDGLVGIWRRHRWRGGLAAADALSFTSRELAGSWRAAGLLSDQRILEIIEAGTTLRRVDRTRARTAIGMGGDPLILWVGRLTTTKDPLTVLDGLDQALAEIRNAKVVMVFGDDTLLDAVEARVRASPLLSERVTLAGRVSRDEIANYYWASDIFISGSDSEGSDTALIESMSAGLVPVITDMPSFRVIAGDCGERWAPGHAGACAAALKRACSWNLSAGRARVLDRYDACLHWDAIARQTMREYQALAEARRPAL